MWLTVYVCGSLITAIGVLTAAEQLRGGESPSARMSLSIGVVAGALWPVVMMGLVQASAIALVMRPWRATAARNTGLGESIQLKEVLAFSS